MKVNLPIRIIQERLYGVSPVLTESDRYEPRTAREVTQKYMMEMHVLRNDLISILGTTRKPSQYNNGDKKFSTGKSSPMSGKRLS